MEGSLVVHLVVVHCSTLEPLAVSALAGVVERTFVADGSVAAVVMAVERYALWGGLLAKQVVDMLFDVEQYQLQPVVKYL